MTQGKIIQAIKALDRLKGQPISLPISYKLYRLRKSLQPHWDWQVEQEMQLVEKYGEQTENGMTVKDRAGFDSALSSVVETEIEQDWDAVSIGINDGLNISMDDLAVLEEFVKIGDDE